MAKTKKPVQTCKECGCTDKDLQVYMQRTGATSFWAEQNWCSDCAYKDILEEIKDLPSKGDKLAALFHKTDAISKSMEQVFIHHNVNHLDLKALPEESYNQWQDLHKQHNRYGHLMCKIING
jgi:hypothetical protein